MDKMLELAERAEKASRPDRGLDAMIHHAVLNGIGTGYASDTPRYTTSLDASRTLVLDGWGWDVSGNGIAHLLNPKPPGFGGGPTIESRAATPALALCAAALRARAKDQSHD